jgi:hypothetical protein
VVQGRTAQGVSGWLAARPAPWRAAIDAVTLDPYAGDRDAFTRKRASITPAQATKIAILQVFLKSFDGLEPSTPS